jgi:hypothetical protein
MTTAGDVAATETEKGKTMEQNAATRFMQQGYV